MEEYIIPPPEGPRPEEPMRVRRFIGNDEYPIGSYIHSLTADDFDYTWPWDGIMLSNGCGIVYRHCAKNDVTNSGGNIATLFVHYYKILSQRGVEATPEINEVLLRAFEQCVEQFGYQAYRKYGNVMSAIREAPEYMIEGLQEFLKG
ncbi:MAG: hypothetical protein ISS93_02530 [Candidatus Aenigmarchaeota archaeon]|nr:hypothetical protein [Candidatus Aenigmarchaeota archaeon]